MVLEKAIETEAPQVGPMVRYEEVSAGGLAVTPEMSPTTTLEL